MSCTSSFCRCILITGSIFTSGVRYEVDFLLSSKTKIIPVEVKSSGLGKHESIKGFCRKYSKQVGTQILLSQKDVGKEGELKLYPFYMLPFILEDL